MSNNRFYEKDPFKRPWQWNSDIRKTKRRKKDRQTKLAKQYHPPKKKKKLAVTNCPKKIKSQKNVEKGRRKKKYNKMTRKTDKSIGIKINHSIPFYNFSLSWYIKTLLVLYRWGKGGKYELPYFGIKQHKLVLVNTRINRNI